VITGFLALPEQARETINGLRAAPGWPAAPRIVEADDLLPERVLLGDTSAIERLIATAYLPLAADQALLTTAAAYLERSPSLEATARTLVVHPNTVRYRLRRIADITGFSPMEPRGAYALRLALSLGRLGSL
jgi:DNA-binding PucR family transcriptional regulator